MEGIKFEDYTQDEQALMKGAPYVMKPLQDWHFKDVLHFFKKSVTNDKSCIKTISEREVDGALIASMNDKEMEAALSLSAIHVKKFRVKLKRLQEVFSHDLEEEEIELKSFLEDNSLGHHFNAMSIKFGITSIAGLKEAVDHTTLDVQSLRIKFAEQARLVKALSSMNEEHADEVLINSSKYKVAARDTSGGKYAPVDGDQGPGQVFMYKSADQSSERGSRKSSAASTPKALKNIPSKR
mmetsp:Transcript_20133/g.29534  ORF Transcript_20133/g.29534 Transcript_20133/m.29534 type:complete len:239 (-) Transcript_20133:164-880(-)